jgi:hypothetical protein
MNIRKVIRRRIRHQGKTAQVSGDVNAVIAANIGEEGGRTSTSSRQRIVQRASGKHAREKRETPPHDEGR